jgi:hypothetical protein
MAFATARHARYIGREGTTATTGSSAMIGNLLIQIGNLFEGLGLVARRLVGLLYRQAATLAFAIILWRSVDPIHAIDGTVASLAWFATLLFSLSHLAGEYKEWKDNLFVTLLDAVEIIGMICTFGFLGVVDRTFDPTKLTCAYTAIAVVIACALLRSLFAQTNITIPGATRKILIGLSVVGCAVSVWAALCSTIQTTCAPRILWILMIVYVGTHAIRIQKLSKS